MVKITDQEVVAISGKALHPIINQTDNTTSDKIDGVVFDISSEELKAADSYETTDYQRAACLWFNRLDKY